MKKKSKTITKRPGKGPSEIIDQNFMKTKIITKEQRQEFTHKKKTCAINTIPGSERSCAQMFL